MDTYDPILDSVAKLRLHAEAEAEQREEERRREQEQEETVPEPELSLDRQPEHEQSSTSKLSITHSQHVHREGYGFRPVSGSSTPLKAKGTQSPLPDSNGLGWPAKSTLSRLYSTPEERAAREAKLTGAVRTLLECIGEDPERDGLLRTPERYAKALMWMTRGYEERLAGAHLISLSFCLLPSYLHLVPCPCHAIQTL